LLWGLQQNNTRNVHTWPTGPLSFLLKARATKFAPLDKRLLVQAW